jgi:hypothetical protein
MRRCLAMLEVEQLAGARRSDRRAFVIRGRTHCVAARAAGNVARAGELDGHAGIVNRHHTTSQPASPSDAYCVCTLASLHSAGAERRPRVMQTETIARGISLLCLGRSPPTHLPSHSHNIGIVRSLTRVLSHTMHNECSHRMMREYQPAIQLQDAPPPHVRWWS